MNEQESQSLLSTALLTDAIDGRSLSAAAPILTGLTLRHESAVTFPEPVTDGLI